MGGIAPSLPSVAMPDKSLRFMDSPQYYTSSTTGSNAPMSSPRRKSSSSSSSSSISNEDAYLHDAARVDRMERVPMIAKSMIKLYDWMLECPEFPHAYDNPSSINSPVLGRCPGFRSTRITVHRRTSRMLARRDRETQLDIPIHSQSQDVCSAVAGQLTPQSKQETEHLGA